MSAPGWPGQPPAPVRNNNSGNRPPVCFKCGQEGHFVIACPNSNQQIPTGSRKSSVSNVSKGNATFNSRGPQNPYKVYIKHKSAVNRTSSSEHQAIDTQYPVQPLSPQSSNKRSSFPPAAAPYSQYPGPAPPPQGFPPQAAPYQQNQHFGAPAPQYPHNQQPPQQAYVAPPVTPQYTAGYQAPPYNSYGQTNGQPAFAGAGYPHTPQPYGRPQPPTPYQQPQTAYQPQQNSFTGNVAPSTPFQAAPKAWNNTPTVPASRAPPPFQRQPSFQSGTPGFQNQPYQARVERHGSQSRQQTPRTPSSNFGSTQHLTPAPMQSSPVVAPNHSKASSTSSTPYARLGAVDNDVIKEIKPLPLDDVKEEVSKVEKEKKEDGEAPEEEEQEEENDFLNREYMAIFNEPPRMETVALAQPLSTNWAMTAVPLLDPNSKNSVSRYARKDNLKEFIKPITASPQWSYLKEDPAFAELVVDCELIPLSEVPEWAARRHGSTIVVEESPSLSRKRSRSHDQEPQDEGEQSQEEADDRMALDVSEPNTQGPPSKRMKNESAQEEKPAMPTTVHVTSPFNIARSGTPCLTTDAEDDAWAPDPGEAAAPPLSPTEALLASLGVTGTAKPPKPQTESPPPFQTDENQQPSHDGLPTPNPPFNQSATQAPTPNFQGNQQPPPLPNTEYGNAQPPQHSQPVYPGPPSNPPFVNSQNRTPSYGPPANPPYNNGQQPQAQFAPPSNNYQNGPTANPGFGSTPYQTPQYGGNAPQQNVAPQYGPPVPQQNVNQQYRPPANPAYGNSAPVNGQYSTGPPGPPQYGNAAPQSAPYNGQQYNQAPQYNGGQAGYGQHANPQFPHAPPSQVPYGPPQGNPQSASGPPAQQQYGPPQNNPQFGGGPPPTTQQQYGPPPQANPQFGNVAPNQQPYSAMPPGNPQFGHGPPTQQQYGSAPQNNAQFGNAQPNQQQYGPPQGNPQFGNGPLNQQQQQYGAPQGNAQYGSGPPVQQQQQQQPQPQQQPQHQQQPYGSAPQANGSFRQDSGYGSARGSYSNGPGQNGFNNQGTQPPQNPQTPQNNGKQHKPGSPLSEKIANEGQSRDDSDTDDSILSPDSREILGKLTSPDKKNGNARKSKARLSRAAPVVEAAYSRRW